MFVLIEFFFVSWVVVKFEFIIKLEGDIIIVDECEWFVLIVLNLKNKRKYSKVFGLYFVWD